MLFETDNSVFEPDPIIKHKNTGSADLLRRNMENKIYSIDDISELKN